MLTDRWFGIALRGLLEICAPLQWLTQIRRWLTSASVLHCIAVPGLLEIKCPFKAVRWPNTFNIPDTAEDYCYYMAQVHFYRKTSLNLKTKSDTSCLL